MPPVGRMEPSAVTTVTRVDGHVTEKSGKTPVSNPINSQRKGVGEGVLIALKGVVEEVEVAVQDMVIVDVIEEVMVGVIVAVSKDDGVAVSDSQRMPLLLTATVAKDPPSSGML